MAYSTGGFIAPKDDLIDDGGFKAPESDLVETPKKKVPTEPKPVKPTGQESSVGLKTTQPTSGSGSSLPSEFQWAGGATAEPKITDKTDKVTVGGKDFEVEDPNLPDMTSIEVRDQANILFKTATPIKPPSVTADEQPIFKNLAPAAIKGNEAVLNAYINQLPFEEKDKLSKTKLDNEKSLELTKQAAGKYVQGLSNDVEILKSRGVESDFKTVESQIKEINSLRSQIETDQKAFQSLQETFLNQKGYGDLAKQYAEATGQVRKGEKAIKPIVDERTNVENQIKQFDPLIKDNQFSGTQEQYNQYQSLFQRYDELSKAPELVSYNDAISRANAISGQINKLITPEYQQRANTLVSKITDATKRYSDAESSFNQFFTPERRKNIEDYVYLSDEIRTTLGSVESAELSMPELASKQAQIAVMDALNKMPGALNGKGYDLAAKAYNGLMKGVGDLLSFPAQVAGGLSKGYTLSDRVADSITDFFAPKLITTDTEIAGQKSVFSVPFYDSNKDKINWSALPDEIANQAGTFAILALTGMGGRMAGLGDAAAIVLPGTMLSYGDALKTGKELYGEDNMGATLYASASSLITGITELIMPDRDILTGTLKKELSEAYVKNFLKGGRSFATKEMIKAFSTAVGKEVAEELVDRWKDVLLRGAINVTGGDVDLDVPTIQENLSIIASTAALTGISGIGGAKATSQNIQKVAAYQAAQNYPETLKQLDGLEASGIDVTDARNKVSNMFYQLKQIPTNLSVPKQIVIAEKMNAIDEIENTNASGVSPVIINIGNKKIKEIQGEIEAIINDPDYDAKFGEEVNKEAEAQQMAVDGSKTPSQMSSPQPESVTMEWSGDDVKAKNVTLDAKSIQSELDNVDFDIEVFNERVGKGFVSNEQITESYIDAKQNGNNPELIDAVEALIGSQPQPNAVQEQSTTGVPIQPEAVSSEEVRQGDEQTAIQETPQESRETEKVATEQLASVKETLPTATAGEVAALIKDGTIPEMLERGVMDDLELMRIIDKLGLPMPQFLLDAGRDNMNEEIGTRTEEEDAELLDLINKAQERTGIPMLEETPKESKEIEKVSQSAGIKATNLRDLYNISRGLFGQNRVKSLASAVIMDRMIGQMAKRAGIPKSEMYGRLEFKKADAAINALELEGALFQGNINGKIVQLRNMDVDVVNGFYSPIEKRLAETKIEKQSANKWLAVVGKGDEATWTGVKAWLESKQPTEQVSKSEIQQWMKDNRVSVVEVVKGDVNKHEEYVSKTKERAKAVGLEAEFDSEGSLDLYIGRSRISIDELRNEEAINQSIEDYETNRETLLLAKQLFDENRRYLRNIETDSEINTKFSQYQLEGEKSDYKEVLVTLPTRVQKARVIQNEKGNWIIKYPDGTTSFAEWKSEASAQKELNAAIKNKGEIKRSDEFKSSHFDEPNILVHLRMNTRTDSNGDKVLFLEEVQSDWGQKGKKEGFKKEVKPSDIEILSDEPTYYDDEKRSMRNQVRMRIKGFPEIDNGAYFPAKETLEQAKERWAKSYSEVMGIPSAPFVTDTNAWVKLALKVALKEAVKQGADKIAWTTGEQQNERYDLSKTYKTVNVIPNEDGTYIVAGIDKEGRNVFQKNNVKENEIEELVGKEIAEKAITEKQTRFEGVDLKVGGKGMIGFYGSPKDGKLGIVGQVAESLFKQKVGGVKIKGAVKRSISDQQILENSKKITFDEAGDLIEDKSAGDKWVYVFENGEPFRISTNGDLAEAKILKQPIYSVVMRDATTQPSITITPELKASVEAGLPLFQKNKGAAMVAHDGTAIIYALTDPNISTPLHELAHVFEHYLTDAERNAVMKAAKTKEWTRETSEYFARGFEKYLAEGISPIKELQKIFDKFKEWLTEIYNGIKGSDIDIKLNKPMKAIYDSMIADKPDISQQERIEKAKQRIDDAAELLKKKLRIDLPEGTKKMGFGQDEFIDLVASAVKVLVEKGIKATDALNQVIEALKDGGFITNKEEKSVRSKALSLIDADMEKVYVSKTGEFTVIKDDNGFLYVRDDKGKPVTASKKKKIVKEFIDNYKFDTGKRAEVTEGVREDEIVRFIADNSENPQEILEELSRVKEKLDQSDLDPVELAIALGMRFIKTSSFLYSGDRNLMKKGDLSFDDVSDNIKLNYLRKNGTPIDLVAQEIEYAMMGYSDGSAVTPSDIIDFIFKYPKGPSQFLNQKTPEYQMLADRFYELTGFDPTPEMINRATKQTEEDFAGLEPETDKDDIKEVSEPRQKKRRFTEQVMTDANVSGQAKAKVTSSQIWYQELPNVLSLAEANAKIDEVGEDAAMSAVSNLDNSISSAARAIIGQVLIRRFEAQGNYDKAIDMLEVITKQATASGQFIQAFSLWARLTPEGQLRVAQREVNKQANIRAKADKNKIAKTKKIVKEVIESAATQAAENVLGKRTQEEKKSTYGAKNKIVTKERANELRAKLKAKRGQLFSNPISEEVIELAAYHLEASGRKAAEFTSSILKEFGYAAIPRMRELYDKAKAMLGDSVQYESSSEVDKKIKLITMDFEAERQGKIEDAIHKKFDRAIKMKSSKLFKAAMAQLMDSENPEAIWDKYKSYAAQRLKTFVATSIQNDADSSPVLKDFIDGLIQNIRGKLDESLPDKEKSEKLPKSAVNILSDALKNFEKYQDVWGETQKALQKKYKDNPDKLQEIDEYFGAILDTPFSKKLVEKTVKEGLKSMGVSIAKIARDHFTVFDATKKTLTEKLIDQAELSEDQAAILADAISKEFDRLINDAKKKMLDRLVKEKAVKRDVAPVLETELMKLLNLGGFSDAEFMESWAKANGYPALTEENIKEISRLADIVAKYDDGFEKFRAMEDLLAYQQTIKGIDWKETMMSIWYAHVLSGYTTQMVNVVSTGINSFFEYARIISKQPLDARIIANGWWNGIKYGLLEGGEVLKSGYNPIRGKLEIPATLEIISKMNKGKFNYAHAAKYVRRVMVAADVVFFEGLREMRAYQEAAKLARMEKKSDPGIDVKKRALAILNKTDVDLQNAIEQSDSEYEIKVNEINNSGATVSEKKRLLTQAKKDRLRRVFEINQNQRSPEIQEILKEFAARATFNYTPEGFLGSGARAVNIWANSVPALRYFIPFTNIIANVANEAINYTPLGYVRALNNGSIISRYNREDGITTDERNDLLIKATMAMSAFATVMALTTDWDEDDDEPALLEITASATGDFKKNYNLKEGDYQEYSFRVWNAEKKEYGPWISYRYTPLVIMFSIAGFVSDTKKYNKDKYPDALDIVAASAMVGMKTFLDMSFLSTIDTFLGALFDKYDTNKWDQFTKTLLNIGKNFVIPNLYTQTAKEVQSIMGIGIKETTLRFDDPKTIIATYIQDIPYARNIYNDRINGLGEIIIPKTSKFVSGNMFFDRDPDPLWKVIADKGMLNLKVPSIKTVKVPDPNNGNELTTLTDDEYFEFAKARGQYIKSELSKVVDGKRKIRVDRKLQRKLQAEGKTIKVDRRISEYDILDADWMTEVQKEATEIAKLKVVEMREKSIK